MVLGFAIFAAVYWSRSGSSSGSRGGLMEFTARASVVDATANQTYTMVLYSHLVLGADGVAIDSWDLQAQVDYADSYGQYRNVYVGGDNGLGYFGAVNDTDGSFNVLECQSIDQRALVTEGTSNYVPPVQIVDDRPLPNNPCPTCTLWRISIAEMTYVLYEDQGMPKFIQNRDAIFTVTQFDEGRTWAGPTVPPDADSKCPKAGKVTARTWRSTPFLKGDRPQNSVTQWRDHATTVNAKLGRSIDLRSSGEKLQGTCQASYIGDGRCDADCNNAVYGYDGGDCCAGKCTQGRRYSCGIAGYSCASGTKRCVFLHGVGNAGPGQFNTINTPGDCKPRCKYWGSMETELQGICSSFEYANFDTNTKGWNDAGLQNAYYDRALQVQNSGGLVFAHSMGNMILGGACYLQNKCSVRWIDLAGPEIGSRAANYLDLARAVLGSGSYGNAYDTLKRSYPGLADGGNAMANKVKSLNLVRASTCGTSGYGGGGLAGVGLAAIKLIAYCKSTFFGVCISWYDADGMVGLDECSAATSKSYSTSTNSLFYRADYNHNDNTGSSGNFKGFYDWLRYAATH